MNIKSHTPRFYDPSFYVEVRTKTLGSGAKTLYLWGVIGIALWTLFITIVTIIPFALSDFPEKIVAAYPDDLVVMVANGHLSINQPLPYYVKNTLFETTPESPVEYLAIFDGGNTLSGDAHDNSTLALIKETYAITGSGNGQSRVTSFSSIEGTTTAQKSDIIAMVDKVRPYFKSVVLGGAAFMVIFGTLFGALMWVGLHMVYLLIPAVLIMFFTMTRTSPLSFKESYMIALHASIPVAIVFFLLAFAGFAKIPFVYTVLVVAIAVINIMHATTESAPVKSFAGAEH